LLKRAVKGMVPHTKLGKTQMDHLYLYAGTEHKHEAQKPEKLEIK
jgi:large subunit ribosomal protein L13